MCRTDLVHSLHHLAKFWKVDSARSVDIDFVDHVEQFLLCRVLSERAHCDAQLFARDRAIAVLKALSFAPDYDRRTALAKGDERITSWCNF